MRRLSRRRPMKLQGFSVRFSQFQVHCDRKMWLTSVSALSAGPPPHISHRVFTPGAWGFLFELLKQAEHIFIIWCSCKGSRVGSDEELGAGWTLLTILLRLLWEILNWKWQHREWFHTPLFNYCTCQYLLISLFLGDIGGQMGLFIGASVLTILEIFDYLYEVKWCFSPFRIIIYNNTNAVYSSPSVNKGKRLNVTLYN